MKDDMESLQPFWASADELYGEIKREKETLIDLIKDLDKRELIRIFSELVDEINKNKMALNAQYILPYLNRKERKRLEKIIDLEKDFLIHKQQLFTAMKIVFKYANGDEKVTEENKSKIGKFLLSINYLSDEDARVKNEERPDDLLNNLTGDLLPVFFISAILDPSNRFTTHSLARQYYNFVRYWEDHSGDKDLAVLEEDFEKLTGLKLKDYFTLCFALAYQIVNEKEFKPLDLLKYFSNTTLEKEVKYLEGRFSSSIEDYKKSPFWNPKEETLQSLMKADYLPIIQKPLCLIDDKNSIILDKSLLAKKILEDPYWILENHYLAQKDEKKRRQLSSAFGNMWQDYVLKQIQTNLTTNVTELDEEESTGQIADFLIETDSAIIVIETKHFIYSLDTQSGKLESFKKDTEKVFGDKHGLIQIDSTIENLKLEEKGKKIYRVIMTDELVPENFIYFKYYEDQFPSYTPKNENISYPIVITKDEFERIITVGEKEFCELLEIRDQELKDHDGKGLTKNKDVQNTMLTLQEHPDLKNKEKNNVYSKELFDELADYVRKYLFPKKYEEEKKDKQK